MFTTISQIRLITKFVMIIMVKVLCPLKGIKNRIRNKSFSFNAVIFNIP